MIRTERANQADTADPALPVRWCRPLRGGGRRPLRGGPVYPAVRQPIQPMPSNASPSAIHGITWMLRSGGGTSSEIAFASEPVPIETWASKLERPDAAARLTLPMSQPIVLAAAGTTARISAFLTDASAASV